MNQNKTLGVLLRESFDLFSRHLFDLAKVALIVYIPVVALLVILEMFFAPTTGEAVPVGAAVLSAVVYLISFLVLILYQIAIIRAVEAADREQPISVVGFYRGSLGLFFPYLWVAVLLTVKVFLWSLLLVIPGIIFGIFYSLATMGFVLDGRRGNGALAFSKKLVKPAVWKYVGNLLVLSALVTAAYFVITLVVGSVFGLPVAGEFELRPAIGNVLLSLMQMLVSIYSTVFIYKLYGELKRKAELL